MSVLRAIARWIAIIVALLVVLAAGVLVTSEIRQRAGREAAEDALLRGLAGLQRGAIPADIEFNYEDSMGPDLLRGATSVPFKLDGADTIGFGGPFSFDAWEIYIRTVRGTRLQCDVRRPDTWRIVCY